MGDKTVYLVQEIDGLLDLALSAISSLPPPFRQLYEVTAVAIRLQLQVGLCAESGATLCFGDDTTPPPSQIN